MGLLTQCTIIRAQMTKSFLLEWINFHSTGRAAVLQPPQPPSPQSPAPPASYAYAGQHFDQALSASAYLATPIQTKPVCS